MPFKKQEDWEKWYRQPDNHERRKIRRRAQTLKLYQERRIALDKIKIEAGCVDCGYRKHPSALQFDHVNPSEKSFSISRKWNKPWPELLNEMAKCVIRCANCHAVRTAVEGHTKNHGVRRPMAVNCLENRAR